MAAARAYYERAGLPTEALSQNYLKENTPRDASKLQSWISAAESVLHSYFILIHRLVASFDMPIDRSTLDCRSSMVSKVLPSCDRVSFAICFQTFFFMLSFFLNFKMFMLFLPTGNIHKNILYNFHEDKKSMKSMICCARIKILGFIFRVRYLDFVTAI